MDIYIDGNRSSAENWMLAQNASKELLPALSDAEKTVADKLRINHDAYARSAYAVDLTRNELGGKTERAARLVERMARSRVPGLTLDSAWLKTLEGRFRFDFDLNGNHAAIWVDEDLMNELLESGSRAAEEQISRVVEYGLPASWVVRAS
ncbi:MAG: hypothetical protein ACYCSP_13905 [Acidobacteriaceae bacterium]